jgi:lipopolysaccharide assembly protein A
MQIVRWIVGATVFLALLYISLQNSDPATLKFFNLASWTAPLVVVVFLAFAAGVALGLLAGALRAARLQRQINRIRREQRSPDTVTPDRSAGMAPGTAPGTGPGFTRNDRLPDGL